MDQVIVISLFHIAVDVVGKTAYIQTFDKTGYLNSKNSNKINRCQL